MTDTGSVTWKFNDEQQRFFDKVSALAERLNVPPLAKDDRRGRYMISVGQGDDRKYYDVFDLIDATLDRVDEATAEMHRVDEAISEMKKATEMKKAIGTK